MAIFRSLKAVIASNPSRSRSFLTSLSLSSTTHSPACSTPALLPPPLLFRNRFLPQPFTLYKLIVFPFHGPLFLSSPPWKLAQSATPLYIQGDLVLHKKLRALELLQRTKVGLPIKLGFGEVTRQKDEQENAINTGGLMDSFLNLPNLISFSRLLSGPLLGWMIVNEWYLPAFTGLAIAGATDWLDGFLARRMGINTIIGSYLDPLADKVLIGCVALAMVENNLLHPGLIGLVVLRDVVLVCGAAYKRASNLDWEWKSWSDFFNPYGTRLERIEPLFISKVNTVLQLVLIAAALLQPEFGTPETRTYITYLGWLVASTTVASTAAYGIQYMRSRSMPIMWSQ
ncbi:hypothetical protein Nepgr_017635 [Nepenthes gracilis]|uniref:Cardiolipin synthase n=1 Tax=Nepenthes gracilis TaxID=150966 RepID=A0AAD3XTA8_NEPGR|nr:hypothetical protein Nepgr_017635 [Nepenthes gracilis]